MIKGKVFDKAGVKRYTDLPAHTSLGGYPLVYFTEDDYELCADCVNGANGSEVLTVDDPQWNIIDVDIYYEGPILYCEHCNAEIESAYGDPYNEDTNNG